MAKFNPESCFRKYKEVAALTIKISAQSTTIEAQMKKIERQQQAINNFSAIIIEQKKVIQELLNKFGQPIGLPKSSKSETAERTAPGTARRASESADANIEPLSQNVTVRPHRRREIELHEKKISEVTSGNRPSSNNYTSYIEMTLEDGVDKWTVVNRKKTKKIPLKAVQKGENENISAFKAVEKKLFLHVWSLHPDTSEESVREHVIKTCGSPDVKVEKIIPKTKRDYSSFMIGVPE